MDYSKLTPEQLLELLKIQSPKMYSALTEPINDPGSWANGDNPMDYHSDSMSNVLGRGYDPNLIIDSALSGPHNFDDNDQNRILFELEQLGNSLNTNENNYFPSDSYDSLPALEGWDFPAADSANFLNQFTDEQLLNAVSNKAPINTDPTQFVSGDNGMFSPEDIASLQSKQVPIDVLLQMLKKKA